MKTGDIITLAFCLPPLIAGVVGLCWFALATGRYPADENASDDASPFAYDARDYYTRK